VSGSGIRSSKAFATFVENIWSSNPIFVMVLGVCSSLAVTTMLANALVMGLSVTFVLCISSLIISLVRKLIPEQVRLIVFMLIISTFVITVDLILRIILPEVSKALGPYIGLIITNCNLMGRAEAYTIKNPPGRSMLDSLGTGLGYTLVLLILGFMRELLASGSLFGVVLLGGWTSWNLANIAPGAFFLLASLIIVFNMLKRKKKTAVVTADKPR